MEKKKYVKPKLDTYAFAQFENVFTACDKNRNTNNSSEIPCTFNPNIRENSDPNWTSHFASQGSI